MVATAQAPAGRKTAAYLDEAIRELYEQAFPAVAQFVSRMGGSLEQAKDIFHDALVIYVEAEQAGSRTIRMSKEAYLLGISKHLWIRKYHRDRRNVPLSDSENGMAVPDDFYPTIQAKRLLRVLELSGKKCMDLLRAFYYQRLPLKKLVSALGYANEHSASVQKYKCLEKIRNTVKEKSLTYEDFTE